MFPFELFSSIFWITFILTSIIIILVVVATIIRIVKAGKFEKENAQNPPIIKEREIIREIVKIRCSYCGNLYDEKLDRCPYCGAKND